MIAKQTCTYLNKDGDPVCMICVRCLISLAFTSPQFGSSLIQHANLWATRYYINPGTQGTLSEQFERKSCGTEETMSRRVSGKAEWRDQPLITTEIPFSLVSIDPHLGSTLLTEVSTEVSMAPQAVCDFVCVS